MLSCINIKLTTVSKKQTISRVGEPFENVCHDKEMCFRSIVLLIWKLVQQLIPIGMMFIKKKKGKSCLREWLHHHSEVLHNYSTEPNILSHPQQQKSENNSQLIVFVAVKQMSFFFFFLLFPPISFPPHVSSAHLRRGRDSAESLSDNASAFSSRAKQLHRRMWWRDMKVGLFCVVVSKSETRFSVFLVKMLKMDFYNGK